MKHFSHFIHDETGAVTVDWVVLTAAITGLGLASAAAVRSGVTALGSDIGTSLSSASVVELGGAGEASCDWVCQNPGVPYR